MIQVLRTADHPQANGRQPLAGEREYYITLPHENGDDYIDVRMGQRSFDAFCSMIDRMRGDDEGATPTERR